MTFLKKNKYSLAKFLVSVFRKRPYCFSVVLRLNDDCNLRCSYCSSPENDREFDFKKLIEYLEKCHSEGCRYAVLTGGEPSMYGHIDGLLDWLEEHDFYVCMNTNGYSISDKKYRERISRVDEVAISLDGPKIHHDQLRGKGSHFKALKAIAFSKRIGLKVSISPVLHRFNLSPELIDYFVSLRNNHGLHIDYGIVDHRGDVTSSETSRSIAIDKKKRQEFFGYLRKAKSKHGLYEISNFTIDYMENPTPQKCESSNFVRFVDLTGDISPCMHVAGESWSKVGSVDQFSKNYEENCIDCSYCSCNPVLVLNNFLKNKYSLLPILRMFFARVLGVIPRARR